MLSLINTILAAVPAASYSRVALVPEFNVQALLADPRFPACLAVQTEENYDPVNAEIITGRLDLIIVDTVKHDRLGAADTSAITTLSDAVAAALKYLAPSGSLLYAAVDSASGVSGAFDVGGMHLAMKTLQVEYSGTL